MENYQPPFQITDKMINLIAEISELIGRITVDSERTNNPRLRRENRIKTIHASLAIENNTLSIEQITAILNGKRVLGHPAEIKEVENAYTAYDALLELEPLSISDLQKAHGMMMADLVKEAGIFRNGNVGIIDGEVVVHMAPPARMVPELIHSEPNTDQVPAKYRPSSNQVAALLEILGEKTMSATELMAGLGLSHRGSFRSNYLNPALEAGLIKRTIPDKPNSSRQKYQRI